MSKILNLSQESLSASSSNSLYEFLDMFQKPNFFIVGAPKCGTTAMASYLMEHPNIFLTNPKEPHFFARDFEKIRIAKSEEQYIELYKYVKEKHHAIGEASTTYLYSSKALQGIYEFNPKAKIIVMLRNPVQLFQSLHSHYVFHGLESEKNAESAWESRLKDSGSNRVSSLIDFKLLQYPEILRLGSQVQRLKKIFPEHQVKIIFFEDFSNDPAKAYRDILNFLNIKDDGRDNFPKVNIRKTHRNQWIAKIEHTVRKAYRYSPMYYKISRFKKYIGLTGGRSFWQFFLRANHNPTLQASLSSDFKARIITTLTKEITMLEQTTGKDLEAWKAQ